MLVVRRDFLSQGKPATGKRPEGVRGGCGGRVERARSEGGAAREQTVIGEGVEGFSQGSGRPGSLPTPAPHRSGRAGSSASGSSTDGFATRARPSGWPSFAGEGIARGGGGTASTASISSATDG